MDDGEWGYSNPFRTDLYFSYPSLLAFEPELFGNFGLGLGS